MNLQKHGNMEDFIKKHKEKLRSIAIGILAIGSLLGIRDLNTEIDILVSAIGVVLTFLALVLTILAEIIE